MSEPISLTALFGGSKGFIDISIKLARALKLIESIESQLDLLTQVEFNAAWKTLFQACNSSSFDEQKSALINDARTGFTKATCLEKNERLFYAHVGLAICHYLLNDINNAKIALIGVAKISIYEDIYLKKTESSLGFNKYSLSFYTNIYHPVSWLNIITAIPELPLFLAQKQEIRKYNKFKNNLVGDIYKKINSEESVIITIAKINQPSDAFKTLKSQLLELIKLQKQCLEIVTNI
ncbi:hypothetical protein [Nostoc sp. DedQUE07]|uniref:hypothetical protein n=1 Tax=Nostoc sp. DedQUE07 TaxID=3075392 RepID=UPI002AD3A17C|nr:hypothetical protein [Nostoc sp. DedQUE07]MDZ8131958.1 hypothetical protein [Nostoc sp. DedQUE07]